MNRQLWLEPDILQLFTELQHRSRNFLLLVVDCSCKNLGAAAGHVELLSQLGEANSQLLMYRVPCCGDNTGSYFRNDWDAERVKSLLVDPFTFHLSPDPLEAPQAPQVRQVRQVRQVHGGYGAAEDPKDDEPKGPKGQGTVVRRWGRKT